MKFKAHDPQNIEIKRHATGEWESLPDGAAIEQHCDGTFEITSDEGLFVYDVRDDRCPSWRSELSERLGSLIRRAHDEMPMISVDDYVNGLEIAGRQLRGETGFSVDGKPVSKGQLGQAIKDVLSSEEFAEGVAK